MHNKYKLAAEDCKSCSIQLKQKCYRTNLHGSSTCWAHCAELLRMFDRLLVTFTAHRGDIGIIFCEVQGIPSVLHQVFILPGSC